MVDYDGRLGRYKYSFSHAAGTDKEAGVQQDSNPNPRGRSLEKKVYMLCMVLFTTDSVDLKEPS
jgi:hypothetical protein